MPIRRKEPRMKDEGGRMKSASPRPRGYSLVFAGFVLAFPALLLTGCVFAPLPISAPLRTTVVDSDSGAAIPGAQVLRVVKDVHDSGGRDERVVRTTTDAQGKVSVPRVWRWGLWISAPGGLPVPNHLIAIWAPGYRTFLFHQYDDLAARERDATRDEIRAALREIPREAVSDDAKLNPSRELNGGKIRLVPLRRQ